MIGKQGLFNGLIGFRCCFMKELIASRDNGILKIIKNFWSSGLTAAGASRDSNKQSVRINPFTLRAAKRGLTILELFYLQKHFLGNVWRRSVDQKPNKNSPSNILYTFALSASYFQKYASSRRYLIEKLWVLIGLPFYVRNTQKWPDYFAILLCCWWL